MIGAIAILFCILNETSPRDTANICRGSQVMEPLL